MDRNAAITNGGRKSKGSVLLKMSTIIKASNAKFTRLKDAKVIGNNNKFINCENIYMVGKNNESLGGENIVVQGDNSISVSKGKRAMASGNSVAIAGGTITDTSELFRLLSTPSKKKKL